MGGVSPGEKRGKIKIYIFDLFLIFFIIYRIIRGGGRSRIVFLYEL